MTAASGRHGIALVIVVCEDAGVRRQSCPRSAAVAATLSITGTGAAVAVLRLEENGKLVTTPKSGAGALVASVTAAQGGASEQFDLLDLGASKCRDLGCGTLVALRAHSNQHFVTAVGKSPLIASGTSIGKASQFWYFTNRGSEDEPEMTFMSVNTNDFVNAPNHGASPLSCRSEFG